MARAHESSEEQEWLAHRVESWVDTYKKSMLTPVLLSLVAEHQPVMITHITEKLADTTGWQITDRSLYRTLKRLQDSGLLVSTEVAAPRTGARRKEMSITALGVEFLSGITGNLIALPGGKADE